MANKFTKGRNRKDTAAADAAHTASAAGKAAEHTQDTGRRGGARRRWTAVGVEAGVFLAFAAFALWVLVGRNADYLYAVQERSLWIGAPQFLADKLMAVGGLAQWAGCYLTQFFYHPWWGSLLLVALWAAIYAATLRALRIDWRWCALALVPVGALLASEVCIGYWLYYLKMPGYWFTQSVSVLTAVLGVWAFRVSRGAVRPVWAAVWTLAFYPLMGAWALVGTLLMAVLGAGGRGDASRAHTLIDVITPVAAIAAVPVLYYQFYGRNRIEDGWVLNIPVFESDTVVSPMLTLPFVVVIAALLLLAAGDALRTRARLGAFPEAGKWRALCVAAQAAVVAAIAHFTLAADFDNANYHAELRLYRAIDECRWSDALDELRGVRGPVTRQMVLAKNIALMNTGDIGDQMFRYENSGEPPCVFDSLHVHLVQTSGPQIYYNYGRTNFATRWAIENGVEYGFSVDVLKMLARCAMMANEPEAARKYLTLLHATTFHKEWANERLAMLRDKRRYYDSEEYACVQPLRDFNNTLDLDEGLLEMYLIGYFSNTRAPSPKLQEQTLVYAMVSKDIALFWPRFYQYATMHLESEMPIHYQEAAYLYGHLEDKVDIAQMPFDKERVVERYKQFQATTQQLMRNGMGSEQVGAATKSQFGDTFWWFYFFCRDINTY